MHEKKKDDLSPTVINTKKKGIIERKPPNDKIILYKVIEEKEKDK